MAARWRNVAFQLPGAVEGELSTVEGLRANFPPIQEAEASAVQEQVRRGMATSTFLRRLERVVLEMLVQEMFVDANTGVPIVPSAFVRHLLGEGRVLHGTVHVHRTRRRDDERELRRCVMGFFLSAGRGQFRDRDPTVTIMFIYEHTTYTIRRFAYVLHDGAHATIRAAIDAAPPVDDDDGAGNEGVLRGIPRPRLGVRGDVFAAAALPAPRGDDEEDDDDEDDDASLLWRPRPEGRGIGDAAAVLPVRHPLLQVEFAANADQATIVGLRAERDAARETIADQGTVLTETIANLEAEVQAKEDTIANLQAQLTAALGERDEALGERDAALVSAAAAEATNKNLRAELEAVRSQDNENLPN